MTTTTAPAVTKRRRLPKGITRAEVLRYGELNQQRKEIDKEHKVLNAKIKQAFTEVGIWLVGNVIVKRTQARSLDALALEDAYPREKYPDYYSTVTLLDLNKVPADVVEQFKTVTVERLSVEVIPPKKPVEVAQ